jgi:hypothetical protein
MLARVPGFSNYTVHATRAAKTTSAGSQFAGTSAAQLDRY